MEILVSAVNFRMSNLKESGKKKKSLNTTSERFGTLASASFHSSLALRWQEKQLESRSLSC